MKTLMLLACLCWAVVPPVVLCAYPTTQEIIQRNKERQAKLAERRANAKAGRTSAMPKVVKGNTPELVKIELLEAKVMDLTKRVEALEKKLK